MIGDELATEQTQFNMAYEITDNGLVVGQVAVEVAGPVRVTRVNRAFLYLTQGRFQLPPEQVVLLPSIDENGLETPSIARDVNARGWMVGDMGEPTPIFGTTLRRAVAWRLTDAGGIELVRVAPPVTAPGLGTYGWLSSVSEGAETWASFTFEGATCPSFGGQFEIPTERICAVRLSTNPGSIGFRNICGACPEPDIVTEPGGAFPSGRVAAAGISPNGARLCGWREDCGTQFFCGEPRNLRARQWFASSLCGGGEGTNDCLACIACITPDPFAEVIDSAARQNSVLDDGVAAGFVADGWPGLELAADECGPWTYVWNSLPCGVQPACLSGSAADDVGTELPMPVPADVGEVLEQLLGSEAFDIERNTNPTQGLCVGHFVVGEARYQILNKEEPARRGLVWFAADGELDGNWAAADVNTLISPIPPIESYSKMIVRSLRGVNRNGDAVGMAEFKRADQPTTAPPIRRAVLLRAVPQRLNGDIDRSGSVDAADLAILFNAWCPEGSTQRCDALSDLSCDGWVGASDLAILLSNWSNTGGAAAFVQGGDPVPEELALESEEALEFSIQFVGLGDIDGYKAWAATAPAPLREIIDEFVWNITKGGVE